MISKAYLLGVLHDATKHKTTYRVAQKSKKYIEFIVDGIHQLGYSAWMYQEGSNRNVYIAEFSQFILSRTTLNSRANKIDYIRGYFE